jgi:hypothetical protein
MDFNDGRFPLASYLVKNPANQINKYENKAC